MMASKEMHAMTSLESGEIFQIDESDLAKELRSLELEVEKANKAFSLLEEIENKVGKEAKIQR